MNPKRRNDSSLLLRVITAVAIIAALRLGQDVVIPLTLAVLLSFLLAYPASWLERLRLGRVLSAMIVLLVAFSAAGGMIWVGAQQLADIVIRLPEYQSNIENRLQKLRSPAGSELAKAVDTLNQIEADLSPSNAAAKQAERSARSTVNRRGNARGPSTPVPVQVVKEKPGMLDSLGLIGGSVLRFVGTAAAVVILTLFILLKRGDLRNRLFRLFGQGRISVMTAALDDATQRVSRYLLTQSLVNGTFGLCLGTGLWLIGVPYAAFWGVIGAALRFIPYVGTLTAGLCPFLLALAVFDGWKKPLLTVGLFAGVEFATSGVVEPWLYATRTGISSLAILLSAAFWTMLWGPIGLVLSTPLTVLLFVLGRYVPQLEFLYILLGDEPVLSPEACYYQRLLAMNEDEARVVVEEYLKEKTPLDLYDAVLIPALSLAEQDRRENQLDPERQKLIYDTTRELIEEIGEQAIAEGAESKFVVPGADEISILCVPARSEADELVAMMLTQILGEAGFRVEAIESGLIEEMLAKVVQAKPTVVIISALPPFAINSARSLCRRVRQRCPGAKVMAGLWGSAATSETVRQRLGRGCSEYVVHTVEEARLQLRLFTEPEKIAADDATFVPAEETVETNELA